MRQLFPKPPLYIGIDVGGTFTDILLFSEETREITVLKVPTAPKNPEQAIVRSLSRIVNTPARVRILNHATTIATNALLTRTGLGRAALITNKGFRDIIEIGRQRRPELYNLYTKRPVPLIRRSARFVIRGRMLADGSELEGFTEQEIKRIAREIIEQGFESVAIGLLNSHANPAHEKKVEAILQKQGFRGEIIPSSEANREYREYERFSTAVVNSVLAPLVSRYLSRLTSALHIAGYASPIYLMNSAGNMSTLEFASRHPSSIIESGPAAGVLACADLATNLSLPKVITFDMGGTTAKAGVVIDYNPDIAYEFEAAGSTHSGRSIKGSGYSVRQPFIDLAEVSAGGGTIAWVDEGGALKLGPHSAGADPGPAAYDRGGKEPTMTDANIVLGRLNPDYLLGGELKLRSDLALKAIKEKVSDKLGIDALAGAQGMIKLVNHNMARAISIVSVERGRDPREFTLIAFGGAGPLHACDLAEEMGIRNIVVPLHPGLFSAFGLLTGDLAWVFSKPVLNTGFNLEDHFAELRAQASSQLTKEGFTNFVLQEFADVQYLGQSFTLTVPYGGQPDVLKEEFERKHKEIYGYSSSDDKIEIVNAKIKAIVKTPKATQNRTLVR
ncbi:MAG: hydantoinase/oxoprolinase family protein [Nitrososphaerales archaeon]